MIDSIALNRTNWLKPEVELSKINSLYMAGTWIYDNVCVCVCVYFLAKSLSFRIFFRREELSFKQNTIMIEGDALSGIGEQFK